jgi:hypothetical protein
MRRTLNEIATMASFAVSAFSAVVQLRGCPLSSWYRWIPIVFLGLGILFAFFALWQSRWSKPKGYKEIANQHFLNTDVLLDGYLYVACKFENVTFQYNGADSGGFTGQCLFNGPPSLKTSDPKLKQMLAFLYSIGMIREDSSGLYTPKK